MKNISKLGSLSIVAFLVAFTTTAVQAEDVDITFLLVADLYDMEGKGDRGGFSRATSVARSEKFFNDNVLYIHAGDTLSPSLMSSIDKGSHVIELLNIFPPDIFVPGNHEYDFGPDVFNKLILGELNSEIFGANIRDGNGGRIAGITDARIYDFEGVKVGVFGLLTPDTVELSSPGPNYTFLPIIETARNTAAELKKNGADLIVAVTHTSFSEDKALMDTDVIDVVLSGSDHDLKIEYNGKVAFAETRSDAEYLVAVDLKVSVSEKDGKRRVKWWPNFRIIDTIDFDPDPASSSKTDTFVAQLEDELDRDIGETATAIDTRRDSVRTTENGFGNMISDMIREFVSADVGMTNGGGIRGNKQYDAGTILTRRDIYSELPFGNTIVKLELSGADLLVALENSVSQIEDVAGRYSHVSGLTMDVDVSKEPGSRVSNVKVAGSAIDTDKNYTLATNDYVANGGDGFKIFADQKVLLTGSDTNLIATALIEYINERGSVSPKIEGRVNFI